MMSVQKVGMYFFIVGVLISILSGGFPIASDMQQIVMIMIIITGGFVGLLNIEEEREFHFLLAGGVFIIASTALNTHLGNLIILANFQDIFTNLIIFTATACVVVGLKLIFHYASFKYADEKKDEEPAEFSDPKKQEVWDVVIFLSVCIVFVLFVLEAFFYTNGLTPFLLWLNYAILFIFLIDAIILLSKSKNFWYFLKHHWADVISIIPFAGVFQLAKLLRFMKIAQAFSRTSKLARISKISHSTKFFSKHSGFNKYLHDEKVKKEKINPRRKKSKK